MLGTCRLCHEQRDLQESHIVPAFVVRWLKRTSLGHLRNASEVNVRMQDGPKRFWLCSICEQRFSAWETAFSRLFHYVHTTSEDQAAFTYGDWALKFAVSVSWRSLLLFQEEQPQHLLGFEAEVARAERVWREFLLGLRPHPERYEQHFIPVDTPVNVTKGASPYLSRYFLRTISTDVAVWEDRCVAVTKLCRIFIIGHIVEPSRREWVRTKLHVRDGEVCAHDLGIPGAIAIYWNNAASLIAKNYQQMSLAQRAKVGATIESAENIESSEVWRALQADVSLAGDRAFEYGDVRIPSSDDDNK